jgi:hypothetical protein
MILAGDVGGTNSACSQASLRRPRPDGVVGAGARGGKRQLSEGFRITAPPSLTTTGTSATPTWKRSRSAWTPMS